MTLRVPLTLTIIPALTLSIAGQNFAIPRSAIEEIVRANGESVTLEHVGGAGVATIRGRRVPEVSPRRNARHRQHGRREGPHADRAAARRRRLYALSVDRIHDHEELVVKPAAPAVMATGLYAGTTLADDGSPILLLDPAGIAQVGGVKLEAQERSARIAEKTGRGVAFDTACCCSAPSTASRRAIRLAVVDRIEEVSVGAVKHTRRPASRAGRRGDPSAGGRRGRRTCRRQGAPVPPQRRSARDRLCLRRSDRLRDDRQ